MASEKQIQANRRNAQRSTGPKTSEGKAAVSQNAVKHGLRARGGLFVPSNEEFRKSCDRLAAEWHPQTQSEWTIVRQMALLVLQQERLEQLEAEWSSRILDPEFAPALVILSRRQAALARGYHKAIRNLLKFRLSRDIGPISNTGEREAAPESCRAGQLAAA
jgi:hypothetical protein